MSRSREHRGRLPLWRLPCLSRVVRVGCTWRRALATALCLGAAPVSHADGAWHEQAETVRALLRADAARVLAREAPAAPEPVEPGAAAATAPVAPGLALVALYGVGRELTAIVEVDGVRKEYRPGASLPHGGAGAAREYRLIGLLDNCAVLRRGQGRARSVCYRPAPEPGAPGARSAALAELGQPLPGLGR